MSEIPPRDWPVYDPARPCTACGSTETKDTHSRLLPSFPDQPDYVMRDCECCGLQRHERPLDFDFEKWRPIWDIEAQIDDLKKKLAEARKAVE